MAQGR